MEAGGIEPACDSAGSVASDCGCENSGECCAAPALQTCGSNCLRSSEFGVDLQASGLRHNDEEDGLTNDIKSATGDLRPPLLVDQLGLAGCDTDSELMRVVTAWRVLPDALKTAVLAIVATVGEPTANGEQNHPYHREVLR